MYIQQVAALANVSVRTLHHYDEIGLLRPNRLANGYRHYSFSERENPLRCDSTPFRDGMIVRSVKGWLLPS